MSIATGDEPPAQNASTTMRIKSTTAFRAYANPRAHRANAAKCFMVKSVNKDGSISRMATTQDDWKRDGAVRVPLGDTR